MKLTIVRWKACAGSGRGTCAGSAIQWEVSRWFCNTVGSLAMVLQHSGRLAMVLQHRGKSRDGSATLWEVLRWFCNTVGSLAMVLQHSGRLAMVLQHSGRLTMFLQKIKSVAISKTLVMSLPNRQQTMLQCFKWLPSLTFLQTCKLVYKQRNSPLPARHFASSNFKGTELLKLDLELDLENSRPLTSEFLRRCHGDRQFPPMEETAGVDYY